MHEIREQLERSQKNKDASVNRIPEFVFNAQDEMPL
jgi:hypothetical protein